MGAGGVKSSGVDKSSGNNSSNSSSQSDETPQQRIDRLTKEVRADHPDLPNPKGLKIFAEDGVGIDGDSNTHGVFDSKEKIRIAHEGRSDNFIKGNIFHELAHLDEALTVAGGNKYLWKMHEVYLDGGHDAWTQKSGYQYTEWLDVKVRSPEHLHLFEKPNINNAPWRKN